MNNINLQIKYINYYESRIGKNIIIFQINLMSIMLLKYIVYNFGDHKLIFWDSDEVITN